MPVYLNPTVRASLRRRRRLLGGSITVGGVRVSTPDFNPVDWWNALGAENYFTSTAGNQGAWWAAFTGTVPPQTKQTIVQQETQGLIKAGVDPATAAAQANSDVTNTLLAANADPSQVLTPDLTAPSSISDWLVIGAIGLAGFFAASRLL